MHGNKYDYSKSVYLSNDKKIIISCLIHGDFTQKPNHHLSGKGCFECGKILRAKKHSEIRNHNRNYENITQPKEHKIVPTFCGKFILVDNEDFYKVNTINWSLSHGYAYNSKIGFFHRLIFDYIPEGLFIDHINGDTLDNKRSNLRFVTAQQNIHNRFANKKNKSSKYKGVSWSKSANKWVANIGFNNELFYLGLFTDELSAAKEYDKKAVELFGDFAKLNITI